ncbi:MAG: 50S ribosomal protein L6 [bacterium]|nr:50S ribosomal protein L6 [bacterium]
MSRIGKQIISIPAKTEVIQHDGVITVKGPLGELSRPFNNTIDITITENAINLIPKEVTATTQALWGTYAAHIKNMIAGVNKKFEKKLIVEGIGFRAEVSGENMIFNLGFSHKITVPIPKGISVVIEKTIITISGINKELVGYFAASLRDLKKPEPYKGKGIRYEKEVIRRKEGKKSV